MTTGTHTIRADERFFKRYLPLADKLYDEHSEIDSGQVAFAMFPAGTRYGDGSVSCASGSAKGHRETTAFWFSAQCRTGLGSLWLSPLAINRNRQSQFSGSSARKPFAAACARRSERSKL